MQGLARQLAACIVDAYCRGAFGALGCGAGASKADLPRDWLSQLLLAPLLRAACRRAKTGAELGWVGETRRLQGERPSAQQLTSICWRPHASVPMLRRRRGPARTRVANACLLAHGVLLELGSARAAKSAAVLHAAVECLRSVLKLGGTGARVGGLVCVDALPYLVAHSAHITSLSAAAHAAGVLALCAGEALLPLQACVALLGPRLKSAALESVLGLCCRAMQRRWVGAGATGGWAMCSLLLLRLLHPFRGPLTAVLT